MVILVDMEKNNIMSDKKIKQKMERIYLSKYWNFNTS